MRVNTCEWREFKLDELFEVSLSLGDLKISECAPGNIPLVSSGMSNNGIVGYVDSCGDGKAQMFPKNTITVDMFCNAFYQNKDFYSVSHGRVNILTPKFNMNESIGLFIATLINKEGYKYSYGRAVYSDEISRMIIRLPVLKDKTPNWKYIEDFIKNLKHKKITTKNNFKGNIKLDVHNWQEFELGKLFDKIYKAKAFVKSELEIVTSPKPDFVNFITRTEENNGCDCYIKFDDDYGLEKGNAIIIGDTTATCFYQEDDFFAGDHIVVCRANWINKYTALFIKSILGKERYRYSYGRAFKMELIKSTKIKLPSKNHEPDWGLMENYIKSLPYGDRI